MNVTAPGAGKPETKHETAFEILAGVTLIIPAGRKLHAIKITNANFADLQVTLTNSVGANLPIDDFDAGPWVVRGQNIYTPVPDLGFTDGVLVQLKNNGVNPIGNIEYIYEA